MKYGFGRTPEYSFGIEEEFQLYHKESLKPVNAKKIIELFGKPYVKTELLENMVELNTEPNMDIETAKIQLERIRGDLSDLCNKENVFLVAIGIYPFIQGDDIHMSSLHAGTYAPLFLDTRIKNRKDYIFSGTHYHISLPSFETALRCMDGFTGISNLLSTINSNSCFFEGKNTGYTNYRRFLWNEIGKELLELKKEKTEKSFFKKYRINTLNPPVGLSTEEYTEIIESFLVLGSWRNWIDYRETRGTIHLRHYDQVKNIEDVFCVLSLNRAIAWTFLNRGNDILNDFDITFEDAIKFGAKKKETYSKLLELSRIAEESPFFDKKDRMHFETMIKKQNKLENYANISDPKRFTADNSVNGD